MFSVANAPQIEQLQRADLTVDICDLQSRLKSLGCQSGDSHSTFMPEEWLPLTQGVSSKLIENEDYVLVQ